MEDTPSCYGKKLNVDGIENTAYNDMEWESKNQMLVTLYECNLHNHVIDLIFLCVLCYTLKEYLIGNVQSEEVATMGGLAGMFEEFREAIQGKGGDDPALSWMPFSGSSGHCFSLYHTGHSRTQRTTEFPGPRIEYTTADLREEIATCLALIDLCNKQEEAIGAFYQIHTPRSRSFEFWFDIAVDGIAERRRMVNSHLMQIQSGCSLKVDTPVLDIPVKSRLLDYSIQHIIEDELKYQTADRTELINIIEDGTYYIANIGGIPLVRDKSNSIWMNYVKEKYPSLIRFDHCCSRCGGELFIGIPYCMSCNSLLSG